MDEYDYNESIDLYEFKIEELKDKLALTEKALELACKCISCKKCPHSDGKSYCYIAEDCGYYPAPSDCIEEKADYFKKEANEVMKSE